MNKYLQGAEYLMISARANFSHDKRLLRSVTFTSNFVIIHVSSILGSKCNLETQDRTWNT